MLGSWIVNQETDSFRHTLNVILCTCCFKSATPRIHLSQGSEMSLRGRAFAYGAVGRRIDPSWGGPIELFLVPASAPRLV